MDPRSKRRWTYVTTAVIGAIIIIAAIILLQQPLQNKTTPPPSKRAPVVITAPASGVNNSAATLNANLGLLGTASTVTVGFFYAKSSSLAAAINVSAGSKADAADFSDNLTGLNSGTQYYFESWALGDGFSVGGIQAFTTLSPSNPQAHAPTVATNGATEVGNASATLNGDLSALGSASSVTIGFRYSPSPTLAGAVNASAGGATAVGAFTTPISGLVPSTTYYVQAWALGDGFANGSIVSFTTAAASGGSGNGHHVPPGWAHAACPDVPDKAPAHGVRTRCTDNETYGQWKKEHPGGATAVLVPATDGLRVRDSNRGHSDDSSGHNGHHANS